MQDACIAAGDDWGCLVGTSLVVLQNLIYTYTFFGEENIRSKNMEEMVTVYLLGKKYSVPATLTIMDAMEYAGFKLVRGCGCRSGFCGACAVIYRLKAARS